MKGHKPWSVIGLVILLLAGVSLAGCAPRSSEVEKDAGISQAQERYDFATEALEIWGEMEAISLDAFELALALDEQSAGLGQVSNLLNRHYQLAIRAKWLYSPPDTLESKDSLLQGLDLIGTCISHLSAACQFRDEGDEVQYQRFSGEAAEDFAQLFGGEGVGLGLLKSIERDLINLKLQAEHDLKQH